MHAAVAILCDTSGHINLTGDIRSLSSVYNFFFIYAQVLELKAFSSRCFCRHLAASVNSKETKNFGFIYSRSSKRHLVQTAVLIAYSITQTQTHRK